MSVQRQLGINRTTRLAFGGRALETDVRYSSKKSSGFAKSITLRKIRHKKVMLAKLTGDRSVLGNFREEHANAAKKLRSWGRVLQSILRCTKRMN